MKIKFVKDVHSADWANAPMVGNLIAEGIYKSSEKAIYYRLDACYSSYCPIVEIHEFGHAIDFLLLNNVSSTTEFLDIYIEEAHNLYGSSYWGTSLCEYFAETFAEYYLTKESGNNYKNRAPKTYEYMDKLVKNLKLND